MTGLDNITTSLACLSVLGIIIDLLTVSTQAEHMSGLYNITPSLACLSMLGVIIVEYLR